MGPVRKPLSKMIFILPPTRNALEDRLSQRGQDDQATIDKRMAAAESEMSHYVEADYLVINDVFDQALDELRAIVQAQRLAVANPSRRHKAQLEALFS